MKKSKYKDEQIAFALNQAATGMPVTEVTGGDRDRQVDVLVL